MNINKIAASAAALALWALPAAAQTAPQPLSLGEAVQRAATQTAGVAMAGERTAQAEARVGQARGALLPQVSATSGMLNHTFNVDAMGITLPAAPGTTHEPLIGPVDQFDARLHLRQALFAPADLLRARAARTAVAGSEAEEELVAQTAAQRAAGAYLAAARAQATLQAREEDARLAGELLSLAEAQLEAGVSTGIDVVRARTQKVTADGQVLLARTAAEQAQITLARAMGMAPDARFALTDGLEAAPVLGLVPAEADSAVAVALDRRPELRQLAATTAAAQASRRAVRAERLPRLDLVADWGASGLHATDAIATRQIGVAVSLPIVDGLGHEARLREQDARLREAALRAADLRQQVTAEVDAALLSLATSAQQAQIADQRVQLAQEELSQARERFTSGVAGNVELIGAQASLLHARDAVIEAHFAQSAAAVDLARAVGMAQEVR
ncbi:TolC family protein [Longimicrobium sp.]|uniref:TolC family protein n=1 Tax=Longimicrobium sp. TaxID=2029185 RepID=UPI002E34C626|nr:TolC family protein [Longimicrobium sp.]HEX6041100.1 TolC family protein [Longimicrobium sp.]